MKSKELIKMRGQYLQNFNGKVPQKREVYSFIDRIIGYLFPILSETNYNKPDDELNDIIHLLESILNSYNCKVDDVNFVVRKFESTLPSIYKMLTKDAVAIYEGDPAAASVEEVIICYPGFYAILIYRIAHELSKLDILIIPRMLTEYSHSKTGIDIHANAKIGESFCIDHGTGVVIGETTIIGKNVKIYQGVTIGALSVSKSFAGKKRHPTIEYNSVLYAGSTILGGNTTIGHNSTIGGNVWLTRSVDPYSVVLNEVNVHLKNNLTNIKK